MRTSPVTVSRKEKFPPPLEENSKENLSPHDDMFDNKRIFFSDLVMKGTGKWPRHRS